MDECIDKAGQRGERKSRQGLKRQAGERGAGFRSVSAPPSSLFLASSAARSETELTGAFSESNSTSPTNCSGSKLALAVAASPALRSRPRTNRSDPRGRGRGRGRGLHLLPRGLLDSAASHIGEPLLGKESRSRRSQKQRIR
ncbi:hypothetical protein JRQ81_016335 [Phrynocephalus forsythii]|uniref:Uncharacterized protein n=1 Tax=Phrynocephalus forsythii TaxID=171643 RepID=A0A9Q0XW94_9SAUR|nr:hypothetical protein JRQ81_016335 [Phrynocephalus forsythii]